MFPCEFSNEEADGVQPGPGVAEHQVIGAGARLEGRLGGDGRRRRRGVEGEEVEKEEEEEVEEEQEEEEGPGDEELLVPGQVVLDAPLVPHGPLPGGAVVHLNIGLN